MVWYFVLEEMWNRTWIYLANVTSNWPVLVFFFLCVFIYSIHFDNSQEKTADLLICDRDLMRRNFIAFFSRPSFTHKHNYTHFHILGPDRWRSKRKVMAPRIGTKTNNWQERRKLSKLISLIEIELIRLKANQMRHMQIT